jgi:hypothetical protein
MSKHVLTISDVDYDTTILIDGVEVHNGSGTHTRRAMRSLAHSIADHMNWDTLQTENNSEEYEDEVDHDWDTEQDYL